MAAKYFNFDVIEFTQQINRLWSIFVLLTHQAWLKGAQIWMVPLIKEFDTFMMVRRTISSRNLEWPCSEWAWLSGRADTSKSALGTALMIFGVAGAGSAGGRHARNLLSLGHDVIICSEHSDFGNDKLDDLDYEKATSFRQLLDQKLDEFSLQIHKFAR